MADIIDNANDQHEKELTAQIDKIRAASKAGGLKANGRCHYCNERFGSWLDQRVFCDSECSTDYTKLINNLKGRN